MVSRRRLLEALGKTASSYSPFDRKQQMARNAPYIFPMFSKYGIVEDRVFDCRIPKSNFQYNIPPSMSIDRQTEYTFHHTGKANHGHSHKNEDGVPFSDLMKLEDCMVDPQDPIRSILRHPIELDGHISILVCFPKLANTFIKRVHVQPCQEHGCVTRYTLALMIIQAFIDTFEQAMPFRSTRSMMRMTTRMKLTSIYRDESGMWIPVVKWAEALAH